MYVYAAISDGVVREALSEEVTFKLRLESRKRGKYG